MDQIFSEHSTLQRWSMHHIRKKAAYYEDLLRHRNLNVSVAKT